MLSFSRAYPQSLCCACASWLLCFLSRSINIYSYSLLPCPFFFCRECGNFWAVSSWEDISLGCCRDTICWLCFGALESCRTSQRRTWRICVLWFKRAVPLHRKLPGRTSPKGSTLVWSHWNSHGKADGCTPPLQTLLLCQGSSVLMISGDLLPWTQVGVTFPKHCLGGNEPTFPSTDYSISAGLASGRLLKGFRSPHLAPSRYPHPLHLCKYSF